LLHRRATPSSAWVVLEAWVGYFGYRGIFLAFLLGSLGIPIPEEMPIVAARALSHAGLLRWWLALPVCIAGVLSGDLVLYWTGRHWGEQVLNWRVIRWVLTPQRETWLKGACCRHAVKTIVTVRHVLGLRAAPFLTAGAMAVAPRAPSVERTGDRQHRPVESSRPQDRAPSARPRGDSAMPRSGPSEENLASIP
jgi:membrane protein DedA with SNARE-associated domain